MPEERECELCINRTTNASGYCDECIASAQEWVAIFGNRLFDRLRNERLRREIWAIPHTRPIKK